MQQCMDMSLAKKYPERAARVIEKPNPQDRATQPPLMDHAVDIR